MGYPQLVVPNPFLLLLQKRPICLLRSFEDVLKHLFASTLQFQAPGCYSDRRFAVHRAFFVPAPARADKSYNTSRTQASTARIAALVWTDDGFGDLLFLMHEGCMKRLFLK